MNEERKSNMELCRIVAMLMIVAHHFAIRNGFQIEAGGGLVFWLRFLESAGKIGVNLFVLLTGYFMVSKQIKLRKALNIWLITMVYSILFFVMWIVYRYIAGGNLLNSDIIKMSLFPISTSEYWFMTNYLMLYLTIPIINLLIESITENQYKNILIIGFATLSVIPTLLRVDLIFSQYIWFIFVYSLGAYWHLHIKTKWSWKYCLLTAVGAYTILVGLEVLIDKYCTKPINMMDIYGMNQVWVLAISITCLEMFIKIPVKSVPFINNISKHTLGIYLIHDNQVIGAFLVWGIIRRIFNINVLYENCSLIFIPLSIVIILFVFGGGVHHRLAPRENYWQFDSEYFVKT